MGSSQRPAQVSQNYRNLIFPSLHCQLDQVPSLQWNNQVINSTAISILVINLNSISLLLALPLLRIGNFVPGFSRHHNQNLFFGIPDGNILRYQLIISRVLFANLSFHFLSSSGVCLTQSVISPTILRGSWLR